LRLEGARYKSRGIARPLFLIGKEGMGKTHLLHAIGHDESEVLGHGQVRLVDCNTLDANFLDRADLERVSVLLVDNADFIQSWLRAILKSRANAGKRSVVTGTSEKRMHANGLGELFGKRTVLKLSQPELRLRSLH
jgi:chromosomal replication initiation ATPase DnaA